MLRFHNKIVSYDIAKTLLYKYLISTIPTVSYIYIALLLFFQI